MGGELLDLVFSISVPFSIQTGDETYEMLSQTYY